MEDQNSLPGSTDQRKGGVGVRVLAMVAIATVVGLLIYFSPRLFFGSSRVAVEHPQQLKTGGTSAIFVVAENLWKRKYLADTEKEHKGEGVEIACESAGTTLGVQRMLDKVYSIAFTHDPVSAELRDKASKNGCAVVHIPLLLCGVVPAYHIEEFKVKHEDLKGKNEEGKGKTEQRKRLAPLNFTGAVLADIFLGKINMWDDPALKAINPGVALPAKKITVVHREDSSGTTQLFTEYLAAVSPAWKEQVGPAAAQVKWPVGIAAERNPGVAIKINEIDGAIGYVDRLYTSFQDIDLDYGAVQNKDQSAFVLAEPANLTAAAQAILAEIPEDLTFSLVNQAGKDSYPITGVIYAVCADRQSEATRKQIVDFLGWAVHQGQADVSRVNFAPLPPELVSRVDNRLKAVKSVP